MSSINGAGSVLIVALAATQCAKVPASQPQPAAIPATPPAAARMAATTSPAANAFDAGQLTEGAEQDVPDVEASTYPTPTTSGRTWCARARPQLCELTPHRVCATRRTQADCDAGPCAETATYVNFCLACADERVQSFVPGPCRMNPQDSPR